MQGLRAGRVGHVQRGKPVGPGMRAGIGVNQRQPRQRGRTGRQPAFHQARLAHRHQAIGKQRLRGHALPFIRHHQVDARRALACPLARRLAHADGHVHFVAIERNRVDRRDQPDLDGLVRLRKVDQPRHQPGGRQRGQDADQQAARVPGPGELAGNGLDLVERARHHVEQARALRGEFDSARQAVEQFEPIVRFQVLDVPADRALGHAQLVRGQRETHVSRGGLESAQRNQRRKRTFHAAPGARAGARDA